MSAQLEATNYLYPYKKTCQCSVCFPRSVMKTDYVPHVVTPVQNYTPIPPPPIQSPPFTSRTLYQDTYQHRPRLEGYSYPPWHIAEPRIPLITEYTTFDPISHRVWYRRNSDSACCSSPQCGDTGRRSTPPMEYPSTDPPTAEWCPPPMILADTRTRPRVNPIDPASPADSTMRSSYRSPPVGYERSISYRPSREWRPPTESFHTNSVCRSDYKGLWQPPLRVSTIKKWEAEIQNRFKCAPMYLLTEYKDKFRPIRALPSYSPRDQAINKIRRSPLHKALSLFLPVEGAQRKRWQKILA